MIVHPINGVCKLDIHHKRMKLYLYLSPCTNINSKYIKEPNLKPEMLTL